MHSIKNKISSFNFLTAIIFLIGFTSCYEEFSFVPNLTQNDSILYVDQHRVMLDSTRKLALMAVNQFSDFNGTIIFNKYNDITIDEIQLEKGEHYEFLDVDAERSYLLQFHYFDSVYTEYSLQFTLLPIIHIEHLLPEISNTSKGIAKITITDPQTNNTTIEYCGIETRGKSSFNNPKKSYSFNLLMNAETKEGKPLPLLGMNNRDKWILDAVYTDLSLTRNRVSFDLWNDIQNNASEQNWQTLPSATEGRFIEMFINSEYVGVYCLNEMLDENKLGLTAEHDDTLAFLYKSEGWSPATTFEGLSDTTKTYSKWDEWEQKLPYPTDLSYWKPLYDFVEFVTTASDEAFADSIAHYLAIDQAIDYYIFINLILGSDNAGKNLFMAKRTLDEPFFICPWDLDATWGRDWLAEKTSTNGEVTFNLYSRLREVNPNQYNQQLSDRWFKLRENVLQPDYFLKHFYTYNELLIRSGAAKRETERWPVSLIDLDEEMNYITQWSKERVNKLDALFNSLN